MQTWTKQQETPVPCDERVIVTDGKECLICRVKDIGFMSLQVEAIDGYEWETNFDYREITHWMPAPTLP